MQWLDAEVQGCARVTKTLQRHGNTHALVIDKSLMEMMGIQPDTPLHLVVSGNTLVVTPANVGFGEEKMKEVPGRLWPAGVRGHDAPAGFGGAYFHEDKAAMAAAYLFHLCKHHPFLDGDKRAGAAAALVLLTLNGVERLPDLVAMGQTTLAVADGNMSKDALIEWLRRQVPGNRWPSPRVSLKPARVPSAPARPRTIACAAAGTRAAGARKPTL